MLTDPKLSQRPAQPYVAIVAEMPMAELAGAVDGLFAALFAWLSETGRQASGAPFIRYNRIDMASTLELEFGVPVAAPAEGSGRVTAGTLPAGSYATVLYQGPYDGLFGANAALIDWGRHNGIAWDAAPSAAGDRFACRLETYLTDPRTEPDASKWQTEVAIKVVDR
jgi:effector-binding domain-containing protein